MQPCARSSTSAFSRWFALGSLLFAFSGQAAEPDPLARCTAIPDREQRWRCYDEVTVGNAQGNAVDSPGEDTCGAGYTALSRQWDTRLRCGSKLYRLLPFKQNYMLARYSSSPNNQPVSANSGPAPAQEFDHTELKFQLSLKIKVLEQIGDLADVWFGYTQQSNWQTFNHSNARPFRDTDYEPELIVAFPIHAQVSMLGLVPRMINFGLVHQSIGRPDPFERSWDRAYLQIGLDRDSDKEIDRFAVQARAWYRLPEGHVEDDNPDIEHYLGYGDLLFFWRHGDSNFSALVRNNLQTQNNRGSLQLNWSVPISRKPRLDNANVIPSIEREIRFYVQFFTGYGETLLDYNHYQTTIGIGIMVADWM